jgi:uncharacterized protein
MAATGAIVADRGSGRAAGSERLAVHMAITTMDAEQCRRMLAQVGFGRLACARNNQPYVVPTYFACEGESVYGFSLAGQKIEWMRDNPLVCLEADEVKSHSAWKTVIATGRYEELTDAPEFNSERTLAERLLQQRYVAWQTPYQLFHHRQAGESGAPVLYCIRIERLTGLMAQPEPFESAAPF